MEEHLEFVNDSLKEFGALEQLPHAVLKADRFKNPVRLETSGPPDPSSP